MNWFLGSIQDAVTTSKKRKAYFVVYVEGEDEQSMLMAQVLDNDVVSRKIDSNNFVAIKLTKGSEGHKQFEDIYKLVPVPSVFFINQSGVPIEIVVSDTSKDVVLSKVTDAIDKCIPASSPIFNESQPSTSSNGAKPSSCPPSTVANNLPSTLNSPVVNAGPKENLPSTSSSLDTEALEDSSKEPKNDGEDQKPEKEKAPLDERIELAKVYLEKKKLEKEAEDQQKEKIAERERRRVGLELQNAKRQKEDRELRQMREEREREKNEEIAARRRILQQIECDRADREERLRRSLEKNKVKEGSSNLQQTSSSNTPVSAPATSNLSSQNMNVGRLQFKLPSGETKSHTFPAETTLNQVREFIDNNIVLPFSEYQMATTFPRREFTARDNNRDLSSLQLLPSAVILILPVSGNISMRSRFAWTQVIIDMMWDLVQPVITFSRYVSNIIFRGRNDRQGPDNSSATHGGASQLFPASTTAPRPGGRGSNIKKRGNIYSLRDKADDDDENNTWNGNSTQQM